MRRLTVVLTGVVALLWLATPASAFAHSGVTDPYAHAAFDVLIPVVVTAPLWTAYLWGAHRRRLLFGLIGVVQVPVAVLAFRPVSDPVAHLAVLAGGLVVTVAALTYARRPAPTIPPAVASASTPALVPGSPAATTGPGLGVILPQAATPPRSARSLPTE